MDLEVTSKNKTDTLRKDININKKQPSLTVVIPVLNEGINILEIRSIILDEAHKNNINTNIIFINDNSYDEETLKNLRKVSIEMNISVHDNVWNKGQHSAIKLGLALAKSYDNEYVGVIDCDMQDPVSDLFNMLKTLTYINSYSSGNYKAIIGVREENGRIGADSKFKIVTAKIYYKLISLITHKKVENSSDFFIITKDSIDYIDERNIRQSIQDKLKFEKYYYTRKPRKHGYSNYTLIKQIKVALKGIRYSLSFRRKERKSKDIE